MSRRTGPGPVHLVAWGSVAILVGSVLPWSADGTGPVWAWDLGIWWALDGGAARVGLPPSVGAVVLVAGLALAGPMLRGRLPATGVCLALAGLVVAASVLVAWRMLGLQPALGPRIGLLTCLAGGALAAGGAVGVSKNRV